MATPRDDLARQRTDLSEDRTVLANERTFAGWLRTGYAGIGLGIAFNALFYRIEPAWVPKAIATTFLLIAILIFAAANKRACAVLDRLKSHAVENAKPTTVRLISAMSILATLALIGAIWIVPFGPKPTP